MTTNGDERGLGAAIAGVVCHDARVEIAWTDGERSVAHALWLRDNCPCPECRHPGSGQRLFDAAALPEDLGLGSATVSAPGVLQITWRPDGHLSSFAAPWLHVQLLGTYPTRGTLWDAAVMAHVPEADYADVRTGDGHLRRWLSAIDDYGFALLHGVPMEPGSIFGVVDLFGYVRETNYGRLFDVRSVVNPNNLAYTGLALGPHTDNPYRDPTPALQLLHCLSSGAVGGETTLVDGFRVAHDLCRSEPALFELLSRLPLQYRFRDDTAELAAEFPVISCDVRRGVSAIHFNNRSRMPFALPERLVEPYYAAYLRFARMLTDPLYQISLRLEPGDLVLIDNLRVLHGRTGFASAGERHLQGCYADRDGLRSKLAVLSRSTGDGSAAP
ncbi:MAG: TauD/TfdA family dioxygenase [Chloroflexi bacterium]|nr:TauD/TfdA family dioxygenase [Chloroflexota bacterium]